MGNKENTVVAQEMAELEKFNASIMYQPLLSNDDAFRMMTKVAIAEIAVSKQVADEIGYPKKGATQQIRNFNDRKRAKLREYWSITKSLPAWPNKEIKDLIQESRAHGLDFESFQKLKTNCIDHYRKNAAEYFDAFAIEAGFVEARR
jgi:hypothetical protein